MRPYEAYYKGEKMDWLSRMIEIVRLFLKKLFKDWGFVTGLAAESYFDILRHIIEFVKYLLIVLGVGA